MATRGRPVRLLFDGLASGEKVVADVAVAQATKRPYRKIVGIEMEAHGFGRAAFLRQIPHLVIKSVSDFADRNKNDNYRSFCCAASADLLVQLVRDGVLPAR